MRIPGRKSPTTSLRLKITIALLALTFLVSLGLSVASYRILQGQLEAEYRDRLLQTTILGTYILPRAELRQLNASLRPDLTATEVARVEASAQFRAVHDALQKIRASKPNLIRYVYVWQKAERDGFTRFLVDADVLELVEQQVEGESVEEISHFNQLYDISAFPTALDTIRFNRTTVDQEFVYDAAYDIYSISGYTPIYDEDGRTVLGYLGIDMSSGNVQTALREAMTVSVIIGLLAVLLASISSMALAYKIVQPILDLNQTVLRFGEKDFSVRARVQSGDEVGLLSTNFNSMADTILDYDQKMSTIMASLRRFVPFEFLEFLGKESIIDIALGDQVQKEMTVFFSDIRSFTTSSEHLGPNETFRFINSYLERVGPEIRTHAGFIDKYIGDAIMALFPTGPDSAVRAALSLKERLFEFNLDRKMSGMPNIQIGIGIHKGTLMLGTIGEHQRMDTTVIADSVNLASRLEGLTKLYGVSIIISETVKNALTDPDQFHLRKLGRVQVAGKGDPVPIWEVYHVLDFLYQHKRQTAEQFNQAVDLYVQGDFRAAHALMKEVYLQNEEDKTTVFFLRRMKFYIKNGTPDNWEGVDRMTTK